MWKVMWWNAAGNAQMSESMPKATAEQFAASLLPEQEARLVYINIK